MVYNEQVLPWVPPPPGLDAGCLSYSSSPSQAEISKDKYCWPNFIHRQLKENAVETRNVCDWYTYNIIQVICTYTYTTYISCDHYHKINIYEKWKIISFQRNVLYQTNSPNYWCSVCYEAINRALPYTGVAAVVWWCWV